MADVAPSVSGVAGAGCSVLTAEAVAELSGSCLDASASLTPLVIDC